MSQKREWSPQERRMEIIETTFRARGPVRTRELAERFGIKQNLLAHDINALVALDLIERGHGWVAARLRDQEEPFGASEFAARRSHNEEAKRGIARYIARELKQMTEVVLDAGSTAFAVSDQLAGHELPMDVYTNNLAALLTLERARSISCHLVGGRYSPRHAAVVGPDAAAAIEGRTFSAGVLAPRSIMLISPEVALSDGHPCGRPTRAALWKLAEASSTDAVLLIKRCLYLSIYSAEEAQQDYKAMLIKNSLRLFIAADCSKLLAEGAPWFNVIIPRLTPPSSVGNREGEKTRMAGQALTPVRSRGPVRVRRGSAWTAIDTEQTSPATRSDVDANAPIDVRDADSVVLVTSTDEDGHVPAELTRWMQTLGPAQDSTALAEILGASIVVADHDGEPVPLAAE